MKKTILLVENELLIAMSAQAELQEYGYEVLIAASGEKAIEMYTQAFNRFDLILMDINLGSGMDGTQCAQKILREHDIPILFLSSHTSQEMVQKTEKITSYGYVVKNSGIIVLDASIKMALKLFCEKQKVTESEQRYENLVNSMREGVAIYKAIEDGKDFEVVDINNAGLQSAKRKREEVVGQRVTDVFPGIRNIGLFDVLQEVNNSGKPKTLPITNYEDHKVDFWVENQVFKLPSGLIAAVFEDVTEKYKIQENLIKSEEKYRNLIENMTELVFTLDLNGHFTFVSNSAEKIAGYKPEELLGKSFVEIVHEDDLPQLLDNYNNVISGDTYGSEYRVYNKNRDVVWVRSESTPIFNNGEIVGLQGILNDVTKQKETELTVRQTSERYNTIIKNFPNGAVFLFDKNMKYIHVDGAGLKPVGMEPESMIGKTVKEVFPDEVSEIAYPNQLLLFEGKTCYYEVEFAGNVYANWGEPVINHENKIEEGVIFAYDITALKKAQMQLQNSHNRFSGLVRHLQSGILYINTLGEIMEVNSAMLKILGSPSAEATKQINIFCFQPLIEIGYTGKLKECIASGSIVYGEAEYISKWEKKIYLKYYFAPIKENDVVIGVLANNEDISEKKQLEAMRSESEAKFRQLIDNSENIVVVKDPDLRVVATNQAFARAAGHATVDTMIGKTDAEIFGVTPDTEPIRSYMEDDRHAQTLPPGESIMREEPVVYSDGTEHTVLTKKYPLYDSDGILIGTGNISTDITDRKRAEEQIKANLREKETLLKEIHHRVKNNMNVVSSLLSLHKNSTENEEVKKALQESQGRIYAMSAVHEALYNTKNMAGIDLMDYLNKLSRSLLQTYSVNPGKVQFKIDGDDVKVDIDKASPLGLTLNELISNALKYAFPGDRKGKIEVTLQKQENRLVLTLQDNGVGMPEGFDWKNSSSLGLKLVHSLIEGQLHGSVEMDNTKGTQFRIQINLDQ